MDDPTTNLPTDSSCLPANEAPTQTYPPPVHRAVSAAHRPPNAFVLFSQAFRSVIQRQNPALSNIEISRLLGKLWKELPVEQKMPYKERAAALQEVFKRDHPDYTYQKAQMKRALTQMLVKNGQAMNPFFIHGTQNQMMMFKPGVAPPKLSQAQQQAGNSTETIKSSSNP
jgi:hypothetical protein